MKTIKILTLATIASVAMTSCHNSDNDFSDFDYQTVYFANQVAGRTVVLGADTQIDLSLDNQHKVKVIAVMGGAYKNTKDRIIHFDVDASLCDNLYFSDDFGGSKVEVLPSDYYNLEGSTINIKSGSHDGGVIVNLTDKFFNDPKALSYNYVLPLVMTHAEGVDSILRGKSSLPSPNRLVAADWSVTPKDYTLYCLKFVNEWSGAYLRRGVDQLTADGAVKQIVRHKQYVERDEEVKLLTTAYRGCKLPLSTQTDADHKYNYTLALSFNEDGTCSISSADEGVTASGSGKFVTKGEKNSISGTDRDGLYLDYTVSGNGWSIATKDTMVMYNRNVVAEYPTVVIK